MNLISTVNIETSVDNNNNYQKLTSQINKEDVAKLFDTSFNEYFVMIIAKHKEDISLNNDIFKEYETLCMYKDDNSSGLHETNIIKKDSMRPIIITKKQNAVAEAGTGTAGTGTGTGTAGTAPAGTAPAETAQVKGRVVESNVVEGHVEVVEKDEITAFSTIDTLEFIKKIMSLLMTKPDIAKKLFFESNSDSLMKKDDLESLFYLVKGTAENPV
jgi:hypothetical protein